MPSPVPYYRDISIRPQQNFTDHDHGIIIEYTFLVIIFTFEENCLPLKILVRAGSFHFYVTEYVVFKMCVAIFFKITNSI